MASFVLFGHRRYPRLLFDTLPLVSAGTLVKALSFISSVTFGTDYLIWGSASSSIK